MDKLPNRISLRMNCITFQHVQDRLCLWAPNLPSQAPVHEMPQLCGPCFRRHPECGVAVKDLQALRTCSA